MSRERRQPRLGIDPGQTSGQTAESGTAVELVQRTRHDRDTEKPPYRVSLGQKPVAQRDLALPVSQHFGPEHEVGEIQIERMRGNIGTLGHETEITEIAFPDHLVEIGLPEGPRFPGRILIDRIEQGGKRLTQIETATAPVADLESPAHLLFKCGGIEKDRIACIQRGPFRRLEPAFPQAIGSAARRSGARRPVRSRIPDRGQCPSVSRAF